MGVFVKSLLAAALFGAAGAGSLIGLADLPREPEPGVLHAGLRIGMTQDDAVSVLRRADPGAFVGQVCGGNLGVVAYVRHLGLDWMLMAHTSGGAVNEVVLYRNGHADTGGWYACESVFRTSVASHYRSKYPSAAWSAASGTHDGTRWSRLSATLPEGTPLVLEAHRPERAIAQCTFDIAYNAQRPRMAR